MLYLENYYIRNNTILSIQYLKIGRLTGPCRRRGTLHTDWLTWLHCQQRQMICYNGDVSRTVFYFNTGRQCVTALVAWRHTNRAEIPLHTAAALKMCLCCARRCKTLIIEGINCGLCCRPSFSFYGVSFSGFIRLVCLKVDGFDEVREGVGGAKTWGGG